jgi:uncharacterized membrane protein
MKKLGSRGQRWLKCFHLLFVSLWVGGGVALTVMMLCLHAERGMARHGMDMAMKLVDDFVIIPGGVGTALTSLIYSIWTPWGWFKHRWITVKWVICIYGIVLGTFFLGPWTNTLPPISQAQGLDALSDPQYVHARTMASVWGTLQAATLLFAIFVSVMRPWRHRRSASADKRGARA